MPQGRGFHAEELMISARGMIKGLFAVGLGSLLGVFLFLSFDGRLSYAQLTSPTVRAQIVPFSVERNNIGATSVNLAFGFVASTIAIEAGAANTDVIAVDWVGGTAVCPAINTSGDARFPIGRIIIKDHADVASISVIACGGTQSVNITAWQ